MKAKETDIITKAVVVAWNFPHESITVFATTQEEACKKLQTLLSKKSTS